MMPPNNWQPQVNANCRLVASLDMSDNDMIADDHGHGSNTSAIAAAVASQASIVMLDAFTWTDANGNGVREQSEFGAPTQSILNSLNWVVLNQNTRRIVAVSISIGGPRDLDSDGRGDGNGNGTGDTGYTAATCPTSLNAALSFVRAVGVIPTIASGNEGFGIGAVESGVDWPGCDPGAVTVGASFDSNLGFAAAAGTVNVTLPVQGYGVGNCSDASPQAADQITCFSNTSALVDIIAPGSNVSAGGWTMSGTSQATPHVAGSIAVLAQAMNLPATPTQQNMIDLQQDLLSTHSMATDPKWNNQPWPRLDLVYSVREVSVWTPIVASLPGSAWYTASARAPTEFIVLGLAHLRFAQNTGSYDSAVLDRAMRAPLVSTALAPVVL
jgi:subtilisin family serine protease